MTSPILSPLELIELFQESASWLRASRDQRIQQTNEVIAAEMDAYALANLVPLFHRSQRIEKPRYTLTFVGKTNTGKSTLLQAIFGYAIAPICSGTATAIPVEYEYATSWVMEVIPNHGRITRSQHPGPESVLAKLESLILAPKGLKVEGPKKVVVLGPIEALRGGLVLVDTPGFGAANLTEANSEPTLICEKSITKGIHDEVLDEYLSSDHVDQVYFCVSCRNAVLSTREEASFNHIKDKVSHIVITQAREWIGDKDAMNEYRSRYAPKLGGKPFIFVEAKSALPGESLEKLKASNIAELTQIIAGYRTPKLRRQTLQSDLDGTVEDFVARMKHLKRIQLNESHWHPGVWSRIFPPTLPHENRRHRF